MRHAGAAVRAEHQEICPLAHDFFQDDVLRQALAADLVHAGRRAREARKENPHLLADHGGQPALVLGVGLALRGRAVHQALERHEEGVHQMQLGAGHEAERLLHRAPGMQARRSAVQPTRHLLARQSVPGDRLLIRVGVHGLPSWVGSCAPSKARARHPNGVDRHQGSETLPLALLQAHGSRRRAPSAPPPPSSDRSVTARRRAGFRADVLLATRARRVSSAARLCQLSDLEWQLRGNHGAD